ncbi:NUDIX domain-containing protein [Saccharopolyspora phatthalungensis]|uniref:8-oxo-dGTP pyrophosphatase MutT (NUDIX family) n=1 Tax=Saccharopolyspora phatthalungensis TaxID=664693 RepID=A0A840QCL3_9PSEU|nr:NUDIX domain-containing protein [Saccharopolyspora phatthalungensis]MBB5157581.1 8-oxo-dGTP pyrophosphatase MutT (NUDIX family) [Saccharopolyspora phatthalungensis]
MTDTALPPALDSHTLLVAAVIVHDRAAGQVLLIQRGPDAKFAPQHWDLPVGKADKGEIITTTAVRELKEETGLIVDPAELNIAGIIHGAWGVEAPNGFLTVVFVAHTWTGQPVNAEPHKHSQVTWFPVEQVPTQFVSTTREALVNYLQHGPMVLTDGF